MLKLIYRCLPMRLPSLKAVLFLGSTGLFLCSCALSLKDLSPIVGETYVRVDSPIKGALTPLPEFKINNAAAELGRKLYHDKRLSGDDTVACSTCHGLGAGGVDGHTHSTGVEGQEGGINAPTVLNAALNFVQFWDGRAATLEDQAGGPPLNPKEMKSSWAQIIGKLSKDPALNDEFHKIYGEGPTSKNITSAIATFERTLVTYNSPFDRFLKGDASALDDEQKKGYELFKSLGCVSCHQGAGVGGNMYQKFGVMGDYFAERGHPTDADKGRYNVTKRPEDMNVFKVPSLRNITLTGPYFHDGSATTLPQAIEVMAAFQLGRPVDPEELRPIARFLESLTGDQPKEKL